VRPTGHSGRVQSLPEKSQRQIKGIVEVAYDRGADMNVTPCPLCQANVEVYQSEISKPHGTRSSCNKSRPSDVPRPAPPAFASEWPHPPSGIDAAHQIALPRQARPFAGADAPELTICAESFI
jgi:hypothetical protein